MNTLYMKVDTQTADYLCQIIWSLTAEQANITVRTPRTSENINVCILILSIKSINSFICIVHCSSKSLLTPPFFFTFTQKIDSEKDVDHGWNKFSKERRMRNRLWDDVRFDGNASEWIDLVCESLSKAVSESVSEPVSMGVSESVSDELVGMIYN